jgi:hypothetical protein
MKRTEFSFTEIAKKLSDIDRDMIAYLKHYEARQRQERNCECCGRFFRPCSPDDRTCSAECHFDLRIKEGKEK